MDPSDGIAPPKSLRVVIFVSTNERLKTRTATEGAALIKPKGMLFKLFCYGPGLDGFQKVFVACSNTDFQPELNKIQVPFTTMYAAKDATFFPRENVLTNHHMLGAKNTQEVVDFKTDAHNLRDYPRLPLIPHLAHTPSTMLVLGVEWGALFSTGAWIH